MNRREFLQKSTFAGLFLVSGSIYPTLLDAFAATSEDEISWEGATWPNNNWGIKPLGPKTPALQWKQAEVKHPLQTRFTKKSASGNPLIFARDGKSLATIIIAKEADDSDKEAAQILRDAFQKIAKAELPVISDDKKSPTETIISIGDTTLARDAKISAADLVADGYRLQSREKVLFIVGNNQGTGQSASGTRNAVYALLERHFGFRRLWPGTDGEVVPTQNELKLNPLDEQDEPAIPMRGMRNSYLVRRNKVSDKNALALARLNRTTESYIAKAQDSQNWSDGLLLGKSVSYSYAHAFLKYWDEYGKEHPEYFALQPNGSREVPRKPDRARLDVSNPDLIKTIAANCIAAFDESPARASVSISPNDGGPSGFCMCENCRRLDPPNAPEITANFGKGHNGDKYVSLSDRYVYFYGEIAKIVGKKYPDKLLGCYAYSAYRTPPLYAKLPPNVLVGFVGLGYFSDDQRQTNLQDWDLWTRATSKLLLRPNALHGGYYMPSVFVHKMGEDIKHCYQTGMIGTDFDSIMHNWAGQGINYYVLAKLLWDPSLDVDEIVKDYCDKGFGSASGAIQKYFSELEKLTDEVAADTGDIENEEDAISASKFYSLLSLLSRHYTDSRIDALAKSLDAAREQANGDQTILGRIDFLSQGLRYAKAEMRPVRLFIEMRTKTKPRNKANRTKLLELLQARQDIFQDIYDNHFYAYNVLRPLFRETTMWESYGWKPDKTD